MALYDIRTAQMKEKRIGCKRIKIHEKCFKCQLSSYILSLHATPIQQTVLYCKLKNFFMFLQIFKTQI